MSDHHGQHARCRACGTNPRAKDETQAFEPKAETMCEHCGADRVWVWSTERQTHLLRRCPCQAPTGNKRRSKERIAQIRDALKERQP